MAISCSLSRPSARSCTQVVADRIDIIPDKKDCEVLVDERLDMSWPQDLGAQKANCILVCVRRKKIEKVTLPLCSGEILPTALDPALGSSAQGRQGPEIEYLSYEERLREFVLFSLEKRRLQCDLITAVQYLKETYKKGGKRLFTKACRDRSKENGFKLKGSGLRLGIRKIYCECGETLEQVTQRSCGCPVPGNVQGQIGWSFGQSDLVEGVPAHSRETRTR
ncbi:hypothetical protein WISP_79600 [Willisornis vidua]|uniref:Uncharacterized protein n=1 Tax=Willisornis vidua TaxID=1566151 RepID=A0ABQ9D9R5_9PASS|nr:hypothetical protein WISP_79600 [Willisornis vidua]